MEYKNLPFATYDLVVYFTTGIIFGFLINILLLRPIGLDVIEPNVAGGASLVYSVLSIIAYLLAGYVIGHILAFIASHIIEKFVHQMLGYPSDLYASLARTGLEDNRDVFSSSVKNYYKKRFFIVNLIIHLPALPAYFLIWLAGAYGFYYPKIPLALFSRLEEKVSSLELGVDLSDGSRWIKIVEHYVANHCNIAYQRLYNYLVIFGLLRSVSLLTLISLWLFIFYRICSEFHYYFRSPIFIKISSLSLLQGIIVYIGLCGFHTLTLMAFSKFNRRFFEEAVYAFLLSGKGPSTKSA